MMAIFRTIVLTHISHALIHDLTAVHLCICLSFLEAEQTHTLTNYAYTIGAFHKIDELADPKKCRQKCIHIYPGYTNTYQRIQSTKRRRGGPAAAWNCLYLGMSLYMLDIFGYGFGIFSIPFKYIYIYTHIYIDISFFF